MERKIRDRMRRNVQRGAALLDEKIPNWYRTINKKMILGQFDMNRWETCMVGSLELHRRIEQMPESEGGWQPVVKLNGTVITEEGTEKYGFVVDTQTINDLAFDWPDAWDYLQIAWEREVQKRIDDADRKLSSARGLGK